MRSIGAAVLLEVVLLVSVVAIVARRLLSELDATRRSCERLHADVASAVQRVSRDTGRAAAGRQLLLRRRSHPASR